MGCGSSTGRPQSAGVVSPTEQEKNLRAPTQDKNEINSHGAYSKQEENQNSSTAPQGLDTGKDGTEHDVKQPPKAGDKPPQLATSTSATLIEAITSTASTTATAATTSAKQAAVTVAGTAQLTAAQFKEKQRQDLDELKKKADDLQKQIMERMVQIQSKLTTEAAKGPPGYVHKIFRGDMETDCPSEARVVRIFVSSTFTDTRHERNWLMEKVYPRMKTFCQNNGYDFQVVDMRWGIRDEAQDDHQTTDICLKEVQLCKQQSTGPCFMSLMSHKYGYRDFPRSIMADEYEKLIAGVKDEEAKEMLLRWFQKDDNSDPPSYVLQPISSQLPDTKSDVTELRANAWKSWTSQNSLMHSALASSATQTLEESRHNAYVQSVSEAEVNNGLADCSKDRLLWFRRIITDIHQVDMEKERDILRRYKDTTSDPMKDEESQRLLENLEEKTLKGNIPTSNIFQYEVKWQPNKGIDPETNPKHFEYLMKLCNDAENRLVSLCDAAFSQRHMIATRDPLFQEVLQHVTFCQGKVKAFYGRSQSLKQIEDYLKGPSKKPLIIHGPSGCGKTSLVAMAAKLAHKINREKGITVVRFIGTTPDSTTLPPFLISLINQLSRAARVPTNRNAALSTLTPRLLSVRFLALLPRIAKAGPVTILLDSLDQFDPAHDSRHLLWLSSNLPEGCKIIVSTLPDAQYEAFPCLQTKFKDVPENFLEVPELNEADITGILDKWLEAAGRRLTQAQRFTVLDAFHQCPLPLYLKLAFDEASTWKSYTRPEMTVLQTTVRACINRLLSQMEVAHGQVFVSRALGYLTTSQSGLSEAELEDILSCDEHVLGDVYRFWTPPVRRLPPLLLVRVKRDLGHYVVNRGADGKQVFYWYHRQFIEAARERYCSDQATVKEYHQGLADFFAGTWGNGSPKPYIDNNGKEQEAERLVSSQPIQFGNDFNTRKLGNQAHHRLKSDDLILLRSECLLNYEFLVAKIKCFGIRSVLDDFREARQMFPEDPALEGVSEALQLSQNGLAYDTRLFSSQLMGRIRSNKILKLPDVSALLAKCKEPGHLYLEPDRPMLEATGGILVHSIAAHSESISSMVVNMDATVAITCDEKGTMKTYNVKEGKVLRTINGVGKEADKIRLACNETVVVAKPEKKLVAFDIATGSRKWTVDFPDRGSQFIVGGPGFSRVLVIRSRTLTFLDADTGQQIGNSSELPDTIPAAVKFESHTPAVGSEKYMVTVESDQKGVFVFDALEMKLSHFKKVLKSYKDEKNEKVDATVDGLAISHDGNTLYMANYQDNDLHLVDTQTLDVIKSYPGIKGDYSDKFHLSNDGEYIYFSNSGYVRVWELSTGKKGTLLNEPNVVNVEDVHTADMITFITYNSDRTLKIWDMNRSDNPTIEFKDLPRDYKSSSRTTRLEDLMPLDTARYFLTVRTEDNNQVLAIFDTSSQKYVSEARWKYPDSDHKMGYIRYAGDWKISFECNRRCRVLDLRTMKVSCVVQGQSPQYSSECFPVNGGRELATLSRGRMNIKLVDIKTGKIVSILKGGQKNRLDTLVTNKTGTKLATDCEGPFLIFDVVKRCLELEVTPQMVGLKDDLYMCDAAITADGNFLLFTAEYRIPKSQLNPGVKSEDTTSIFVFNIAEKKLDHVLCDVEAYNKLMFMKSSDTTVSVDGLHLLDESRVVSTHDDFEVRVWDFKAGTLLHRLKGHISYVTASVKPGSDFLLTNGSWDEEYTLRLWDTKTWQCIALYRYEADTNDVQLMGPESCTLIGRLKTGIQPIIFKLKGQGSKEIQDKCKAESSFPVVFELGDVNLDLSHPDDDVIDDDNPDSDPEEVDEDDEDDDDDDDDDEEEISDDDEWLKEKN